MKEISLILLLIHFNKYLMSASEQARMSKKTLCCGVKKKKNENWVVLLQPWLRTKNLMPS
jgi:hypothetical protein